MSKREKELREELDAIEAEAKKKEEKWYKYKEAGCNKCHWVGHIYRDAGMGFNDKIRCDCTYIETERYQKAKNATHLSVDKYNKKLNKFKDNNKKHNSNIWSKDRSF